MLTEGQLQRLFAVLFAELIQHIHSQGYECSIGEVKRSDEQAAINAIGETGRLALAQFAQISGLSSLAEALRNNGKNNGVLHSVHQLSLAADINLFKDGAYLDSTEAHRVFGEWWEQQHALARWGGRWGDGNHYSLEFNGVK
jgi:hypothetical protein